MSGSGYSPHPLDRWVALAACAYAVGLIVYGTWVHVVPGDSTAECDGYVKYAAALRAGELPPDAFRPLLYPALIAAWTGWLGDAFAAGRLVSSLAAGLALWWTYRLGRCVASPKVGVAAAALLACNAGFVVQGVVAATDMVFTALVTGALVCSVAIADGGRRPILFVLVGALTALAWSTRYVGIVMWLPILLSVWLARAGWIRLATVAVAFGVVALPQMVANVLRFGSPFHNENWRNLLLKLDGQRDWNILSKPLEAEGWSDVVSNHFGAIVTSAGEQFAALVDKVPALLGPGLIGVALASIVAVVLLVTLVRPRATPKRHWPLWVFVAAYVAGVCVVFYAWTRLLLPIAPVAVVFACAAIARRVPLARVHRVAPLVASGAVLVVLAWQGGPTLRRFEEDRSPEVFAAAAWLQDEAGSDCYVLGDYPRLRNFVEFEYVPERVGFAHPDSETKYVDMLSDYLDIVDIDYVMFSAKWLGRRPRRLLDGPAPDYLELIYDADGVVIYAVRSS